MDEVKKKTKKKASTTSKVQSVSRKKKVASDLSNDELLEQILNKKKNKKKSSTVKNKSISSSSKKNPTKKNNDLSNLSNDELYDLIKSKKSKKTQKKDENSKQVPITEFKDKKDDVSKNEILDKEKSKSNDLIITREITFTDENLDLNNKKILKELKQAIEEFDSLDDSTFKKEKIEKEDIVETKCVDKRTFSKKYILLLIIFTILVLLVALLIVFALKKDGNKTVFNFYQTSDNKEEIDLRPQMYEDCLNRPLDTFEKNGDIILAEEKLTEYLKNNYEASVMYEDLNLGFSYSYNSEAVYYAASTIKSLDALYIYTKAAEGKINLDDTMVYSKKYKWSSSREMSKYKYGEKVSLRDLVRYAITVSDNSAHQMLVSYIGRNTLKEFGKSLGATETLSGSDNFGNITVADALIYMKAINDFINNNEELGEELQSFFFQADQNGLEISESGIRSAHKYGEYSYFYHDIGIVYDERPYVVAILTHEGNDDFIKIIKDINSHIYDLHKLYYSNRENVCHLEVYGN